MSDDARKELEELEAGLSSEFWKLLSRQMQREWGPGGVRYQQAVEQAAESPNAVTELQKLLHTSKEVARFLQWPHDRVSQLKAQLRPNVTSPSRRGPGL